MNLFLIVQAESILYVSFNLYAHYTFLTAWFLLCAPTYLLPTSYVLFPPVYEQKVTPAPQKYVFLWPVRIACGTLENMTWKPSTVEDIRKWVRGEYVPNASPEEFKELWLAQVRRNIEDGTVPRVCLVPLDHPSKN